jgi:hypothetical protein
VSALGSLGCGSVSLVALLALGCGKTGVEEAPSLAAGGAGAGMGGAPVMVEPDPCGTAQTGPRPTLRLNGAQLARSFRDLLRDAPAALARLEPMLANLPQDDVTQPPGQELVGAYHRLAHEAALVVSDDAATLAAFAGCEPAAPACRDDLVHRFLTRTLGRSPTTDEVAEALSVFEQGRALGGGSFASGVRALVEVALQGPDFLYRSDGCRP